jgi:uncharacterized protein (TIGR02246 family)
MSEAQRELAHALGPGQSFRRTKLSGVVVALSPHVSKTMSACRFAISRHTACRDGDRHLGGFLSGVNLPSTGLFLLVLSWSYPDQSGQAFGWTHRCFGALCATHVLLTFLFVAGCSVSVRAQSGSSRSEPEQSPQGAVRATYAAYLRAWKDKDLNALDHILSDDYQAVNVQGIVSRKANEVATAIEDRTYNSLTADLISVALFGNCAIASGLIEANWKDEHGNPQRSTFRFLALLQKQKGNWKLVATQSTKFNKVAEPVIK